MASSKMLLPIRSSKFFFTLILLFCFYLNTLQIHQVHAGPSQWNSVGLQERTINALVIHPLNPNTLYAGTATGVFKSIDHGATWNAGKTGLPDDDILALVIDPNNSNVLYAGARRNGVFKSTDGGCAGMV